MLISEEPGIQDRAAQVVTNVADSTGLSRWLVILLISGETTTDHRIASDSNPPFSVCPLHCYALLLVFLEVLQEKEAKGQEEGWKEAG